MENKVKTSAGQETASETVARINAARAAAKDTPAPTSPKANAVMEALTERLTNQSKGISTSSSSELQSYINEAISGVKQSGEATFQRLESERGREIGYAQDRVSTQFTGALESRSGYATQVVALRELTETTEKSLRDLDKRYQEAIMANDANTASTIAGLQMKKLEFLQQQEQQFFTNTLSLASLQESQASREQQAYQFQQGLTHDDIMFEKKIGADISMFEKTTARDERNMLLSLAAEHGVAVGANDTIDTMIGKISPFVNSKKALELEALRADIRSSNASAAKALQGKAGSNLGDAEITALAMAYAAGNEDVINFIEDGATMSKILNKASSLEKDRKSGLDLLARSASSKEALERLVSQSDTVDATQAEIDSMAIIYGQEWAERNKQKDGWSSYGKNTNFTNEEKVKLDQLRGVTISQGK